MLLKRLQVLCLLLLVQQCLSWINPGIRKPGNITIGALLPVHGTTEEKVCSQLRPYGLGFVEALIYCVERINKNQQIFPGITLGYDIRDYCESPTLGMKMTHEFVKQNFIYDFDLGACGNRSNNMMSSSYGNPYSTSSYRSPISAVIGAHDSGTTVLVAELLNVVNLPLISPFSTSEQLSFYPTFFRTIPPDGLQARVMVDLIAEFKWEYVGVVAVDHSYGRYGARYLEKEAFKKGVFCLGSVQYFPRLGYQTKMESIILKFLRQRLVRVIVLWANSGQTLDFLKKATEMGLRDIVWILSDDVSLVSTSTFQEIAHKINGVFIGTAHRNPNDLAMKNHLKNLILSKSTKRKWWNEFFKQEYNCTSPGLKSPGFSACNKTKIVSSALSKLYNPYTPYLIDAVEAIAKALKAIYTCDSKQKRCPNTKPYIKSKDLLEYLKNVSFHGLTGKVGFDRKGNPISSSYDIIHLHNNSQGVFVKTKVGGWSIKKGLMINKDLIKWNGANKAPPSSVCMEKCSPGTWQTEKKNCCWECNPCEDSKVSVVFAARKCTKCSEGMVPNKNKSACIGEEVINITLASETGIIFAIISGFGIILALAFLLLFLKHHTTPLVKASNRELSFLLLLTIVFGFVLALLHISFPMDEICYWNTLSRYSLHCLCISILFIKTVRIAGAFQLDIVGIPKCCKRFVVNSKLQVITLIVLNTCPVTFALLWRYLDPPYVIITKTEVPKKIEVEYFCQPFQGNIGFGLQLCSLFYLTLMTFMCIFYSFKARNLPGNFNETKHIGMSLYIILVSWLAYYPINFLLKGYYVTVISSATSLLASYGILSCIFMPRVYIILLKPHKNTNESVRAQLRCANVGPSCSSAHSQ